MPATSTEGSVPIAPLTARERLELANRLYREFRTRCFWHCPPRLVITEDLVPRVIKGLRNHGGRRGFILAGKLLPPDGACDATAGDTPECR